MILPPDTRGGRPQAPASSKGPNAIGVDLGTTFSVVAHIDAYGTPQIIPNAENERITPSVILFENDAVVVGRVAMQSAMAEPEKIVDFVKREMGKTGDQFHREFGGVEYTAEQLSALIVKKLKNDAEKYLKQPVTHAVITVPAYFSDSERTATIHAGQLAGLEVLQVLNEPTAAALAYGLTRTGRDQTAMVFDLGGGTFDVTLMRIEGNHIQVLASNGDHRLGGKDWDDVILHWVADEFDRTHDDNPLLDLQSYQELQARSTIAKIQLSTREHSTVVHSYNGKSVKVVVAREDFEARARPLIDRCRVICQLVMFEAGLVWSQLDRIILTGGMSRMPAVRRMIADLAKGVSIDDSLSPDEAVAVGAAIQGTLLMLDREPPQHAGGSGSFAVPSVVREQFSDRDGTLLHVSDVTTHTLGLVLWDEALGEETVFRMLPKGTAIPATANHCFSLVRANMASATVRVVEGESTVPSECTPLGVCCIDLPERLPKETPVHVAYAYDENQVLQIVVEVSGHKNAASIRRTAGLSGAEFKRAAVDICRWRVI